MPHIRDSFFAGRELGSLAQMQAEAVQTMKQLIDDLARAYEHADRDVRLDLGDGDGTQYMLAMVHHDRLAVCAMFKFAAAEGMWDEPKLNQLFELTPEQNYGLADRRHSNGCRAKNEDSASATSCGRSMCRRCVAPARSTGSTLGSQASRRSRRSRNVGALFSPTTARTGCVIRCASVSANDHCYTAGSSWAKKVSAQLRISSKSPGRPRSSGAR